MIPYGKSIPVAVMRVANCYIIRLLTSQERHVTCCLLGLLNHSGTAIHLTYLNTLTNFTS